ncbi:hypothetical protein MTO98_07335 [Mucilaginibacter sp. SMC90]|uniref:hypothetical protein n=1 Tax=Mucilaginibacter sp. SMC90 TaxID=2929803 RepID=UPI001FB1BA2A|nr:hypothetical protein [Mucilaginibacter sp. SMC90]UOE50889.1 hypothetical protein MTO98_07335 [Mucilaginibacter sp. SMC90]
MSSNKKHAPQHSTAKLRVVVDASKPKGENQRVISLEKARNIALDWHSGVWSWLYTFGSSGILLPEAVGRTIKEIDDNLETPDLPQRQIKRLRQLQRYVAHPSSALQVGNQSH